MFSSFKVTHTFFPSLTHLDFSYTFILNMMMFDSLILKNSYFQCSPVDPLNSGHHCMVCPLETGCPLLEVILYRVFARVAFVGRFVLFWSASVLYWTVQHIPQKSKLRNHFVYHECV